MELLAPAGSLETLRAVCAAGADAVYVGGQQFGARAYAKNFTKEELSGAIDEVHLQGKKLHLTVNILLKNQELEEQLYDYLLPYYERGLDAVIVQDAGVFSFIKTHFPNMEIHASTQMTIAGTDGARFWAQAGADRVVLSRELSLREIAQIHQAVDVPLECFAHGALCYSYSGQCLFSSMLGGRSGNRGRCAQPCRLPYQVSADETFKGGEALYPLSLKDLCTIDLLPEMQTAGVASLKIEGRMKQAAYAAGVTAIYRKYLDLLESGAPYEVQESDRQALLAAGNRSGFTAGYLRGEKGAAMVSLRSPKHTSEQSQEQTLSQPKKRMAEAVCRCVKGQPAQLTVKDVLSGCTVTVTDGEIEAAKNSPATVQAVTEVLNQTGDTPFCFASVEVQMDADCFVPKQFLKRLRRGALEQLQEQLLIPHRRIAPALTDEGAVSPEPFIFTEDSPVQTQLIAVCDTWEQLVCCAKKDYIRTLALQAQGIPAEQLSEVIARALSLCQNAPGGRKGLVLAMPCVFRNITAKAYEKLCDCIKIMQESDVFEGFLAKNYDTLGFLQRMDVPARQILLDASLYTFSDRSKRFFMEMGYRCRTLPLELTVSELRVQNLTDSMLVIYGHTPFMVSSQCVNRTMYGCDHKEKCLYLTDRYGKHLPVRNYCQICSNVVYNAEPTLLFTAGVYAQVEKLGVPRLRMDFTVETPAQTDAVLGAYEKQVLKRTPQGAVFDGASTRGHFRKGVE